MTFVREYDAAFLAYDPERDGDVVNIHGLDPKDDADGGCTVVMDVEDIYDLFVMMMDKCLAFREAVENHMGP